MKTPKHEKITQFGALAGQKQHMAAQKVGFTPRPIKYGPLTGTFQAQLHWNLTHIQSYISELHIRAELETCQLRGPYPGSKQKPYHFWSQITPSGIFKICSPCN